MAPNLVIMGIWLWDIMGCNPSERADYVSSNLYLILVKLVK